MLNLDVHGGVGGDAPLLMSPRRLVKLDNQSPIQQQEIPNPHQGGQRALFGTITRNFRLILFDHALFVIIALPYI